MSRWALAGAGALLVLWAGMVRAHDFWLDPSTYRPLPGDEIDIVLRLGHGSEARTVARDDDVVEQFVLVAGDRVHPIGGVTGDDPAGHVVVPDDGCWSVAYEGGRSFSALSPARFEDYLQQKGLDHVAEDRRVRGERERYGTEVYSRCAKALLQRRTCDAGAQGRPDVMRPIGLTLEIVPEADPASLHPGDRFPIRMLFRGQPVGEVLVEAVVDGERTKVARTRTDGEGRASIALRHPGHWLLSAVYMERGAGPERADWESWWASLSFQLHGARWNELRFDRRRFVPGVPMPTRPGAPGGGR